MIRIHRDTIRLLVPVVAALAPFQAWAGQGVLTGDTVNGGKLYRANCAECHGTGGDGLGPAATLLNVKPVSLHDGYRMSQRSDAVLAKLINEGGKAIGISRFCPGFGKSFSQLDTWDLIAYVRTLHPQVSDYFPEATHFLAKTYKLPKNAADRVKKTIPSVTEGMEIAVIAVYKLDGGEPGNPMVVAHDPKSLDTLKKEGKIGFLSFLPVATPEGVATVGVAHDPKGVIMRLSAQDLDPAKLAALDASLAKFQGLGKRGPKYEPFKLKGPAEKKIADAVFQAWVIATEGAILYDIEERDRTRFDDAFK